jgi:hypothetical protein
VKTKGILIAAFVFVLSAFASAGTVSFTTSGTFTSTGSSSSTTGISFVGATDCATGCAVSGPINYVNLGTFYASTPGSATSDTFTLTITQTSPAGVPTGISATVTGNVKLVGGKLHSKAKVDFTGTTTVTIAGVTYTVTSPDITVSTHLAGSTLNGNIAAPEPSASLLLGLASLGLFGFALVSRGRMVNT